MSTSGSGDPFHGDKRTDETVMISSENLSDLVAQAKSAPDAAAPVADGDTGPNKTLIMVAAIVAVVVVLAVLVFALG